MNLPVINTPVYTTVIPSTQKEISYRPFLVKEEKMMLTLMETEKDDIKLQAENIKRVIEGCTFGKINVNQLTSFDIEWLFVQLRIKSKGEVVDLHFECPKCKTKTSVKFNLNDVTIKEDKTIEKNIKINDTVGIMMKYPDFNSLIAGGNQEDFTKSIISCIEYIYNGDVMHNPKDYSEEDLVAFIDSLPSSEAIKINEFFEKIPKVVATIDYKCRNPDCGYEEKIEVTGIESFLA